MLQTHPLKSTHGRCCRQRILHSSAVLWQFYQSWTSFSRPMVTKERRWKLSPFLRHSTTVLATFSRQRWHAVVHHGLLTQGARWISSYTPAGEPPAGNNWLHCECDTWKNCQTALLFERGFPLQIHSGGSSTAWACGVNPTGWRKRLPTSVSMNKWKRKRAIYKLTMWQS